MDIMKALSLATKVVNKRSTIPMLRGVLVTIDAGVVAIQATDCDQALTVYCPMPDLAANMQRIVDPAVLAASIKAAPQVALDQLLERIPPICDAGDWWVEPALTAVGSVTLLAHQWRDMLKSVGTAMSGEETR